MTITHNPMATIESRTAGTEPYLVSEKFLEQANFAKLADQWENETVLLSSMEEATRHPAYREIVAMGKTAIPPILERMNEGKGHWFLPLLEITGENPVEPADRGNIAAMEDAWRKWGQRHGYNLNGNHGC